MKVLDAYVFFVKTEIPSILFSFCKKKQRRKYTILMKVVLLKMNTHINQMPHWHIYTLTLADNKVENNLI